MPILLDFLYLPLALLYLPILLYQMIALGKNRRGWRERFGGVPERGSPRPSIWIHAVSLGEVNATRTLVDEIAKRVPDYEIVISTTTDTGYAAAKRQYPTHVVFRYPLDFSWVVRRVLRRIRPAALILMELEVWPNLIAMATDRGIPVCIANGRITEERSMRRFRKPVIRSLAKRMFSRIAWVAAQEQSYASRFIELGVSDERVFVGGNLKYDTALVTDSITGADALAAAMLIDQCHPLIVAGSTGPGEEELILDAFTSLRARNSDVQLAIIPRKPERFDEVARLIEASGHPCIRRSQCPDAAANKLQSNIKGPKAVVLGDTMGELRKFYSLATVVFVGRTLVPLGGSDLMEVAALGKAMCFGPYVENFADVAAKLLAADGAVQFQKVDELGPTLARLLDDSAASAAMAARGRRVVVENRGATARTVDRLIAVLNK